MSDWIYIGLGSNLGESLLVINQAKELIQKIHQVHSFEASSFYRTKPVSPIPQEDFINAVCRFKTSLSLKDLFSALCEIEKKLGKVPKAKEAPRMIDIDLLLYKEEFLITEDLQIPHPRFMQRLFVLIPMRDLTDEIIYPLNIKVKKRISLDEHIGGFSKKEEWVFQVE